jgi:prepilin-type N-terminal cleavage/methylation domain-containing protein
MHPKRLVAKNSGFTLVEIMIVAAIIALLVAIAVHGFLRARKRTQSAKILNDLRHIDSAIDQYALETNKAKGNTVAVADWTNYLKRTLRSTRQAKTCLVKTTDPKLSIPCPRSRQLRSLGYPTWLMPLFGP